MANAAARLRILVIDDDDRAVETAKGALSPYSVDVEAIRDGNAALERARAAPPNAIVLAVELAPQKQGYNLCRRLKKSAELKQTPVLLVSIGDPYLEDHKKLSTRADAYLLKPFTARHFVETLQGLVGPLPGAAVVEAEEIVELDEASEVAPRDVTAVVEMIEDVSDEDILDVEAEEPEPEPAAPPMAPPPPFSPPPPVAAAPAKPPSPVSPKARTPSPFETSDDDNFDAMLDSLEFKEEVSAKVDRLAAGPAAPRSQGDAHLGRPFGPATAATTPTPSPPAPTAPRPVAPAPAPSPSAPPRLSLVPEPEVEHDREILDLKERLSRAEHLARERAERLALLEQEIANARERLEATEAQTAAKAREIAEEMAARDLEISQRRTQLEQLAGDHASGVERLQREHGEALARLRAELSAEKERALEAARLERHSVEAAFQQRLREAEALHDRSLAEARREAQRHRDDAEAKAKEVEALRSQLLQLEREHREAEVSIHERIAAAADEARRPLEELMGARAEQHARELQELRRLAEAADGRAAAAEARAAQASVAIEARAELEARVRDLEGQLAAAGEKLGRVLTRMKAEERRRESLKRTAEILLQLLEDQKGEG
jgi:CheY-like chemotaxis protein